MRKNSSSLAPVTSFPIVGARFHTARHSRTHLQEHHSRSSAGSSTCTQESALLRSTRRRGSMVARVAGADIWFPLALSTLAGLSTTIGAAAAVVHKPSQATMAGLLGVAIGVMATVSVVELIVRNAMKNDSFLVVASAMTGALAYYVLEPFFPTIAEEDLVFKKDQEVLQPLLLLDGDLEAGASSANSSSTSRQHPSVSSSALRKKGRKPIGGGGGGSSGTTADPAVPHPPQQQDGLHLGPSLSASSSAALGPSSQSFPGRSAPAPPHEAPTSSLQLVHQHSSGGLPGQARLQQQPPAGTAGQTHTQSMLPGSGGDGAPASAAASAARERAVSIGRTCGGGAGLQQQQQHPSTGQQQRQLSTIPSLPLPCGSAGGGGGSQSGPSTVGYAQQQLLVCSSSVNTSTAASPSFADHHHGGSALGLMSNAAGGGGGPSHPMSAVDETSPHVAWLAGPAQRPHNLPVVGHHQVGLLRLGLLMAITMTLHNIPEGFAVAFSAYEDTHFGVFMAVAIALHNIPEGVIIAAPIFAATNNRWKALGLATASGLSEPLGAALALVLLHPYITPDRLHYLLACVGGLMVAVCVIELWPEALACKNNRALALGTVLGVLVMGWTLAVEG